MGLDLWSRTVLLASLLVSISGLLACDSGGGSKKACGDGATQSCQCDGGSAGKQTCSDGAFGACSCGPINDSGPGSDSGEDLGRLKGRVFDADTGRAVDDADLKFDSGDMVKSDAKGNFELKSAKEPKEVEVSKVSYAATVKRPPAKGGYMEVFIKDVDDTKDFDADKGVRVQLSSGASIEIPPGAVRDAEGKRVTGMVKLTVSDVDGNDRKQGASLPELKGERGADKGRVSIYRAMDIKIVDKDNNNLTVSKDDKVVADFPAKDVGAAERSGLSYDEKKEAWVEEGKAKRTVNDKGERVYRKDIDHLSWHGYGDFFASITCLRVCVQDGDKNPLPGAQIWLVGASFPGVSTIFTGDDGCASGDAPTTQEVVLVGQTAAGVSKALSYKTGPDVQSADDDPTKCDDGAAPLVVGTATPSSCPSGYAECGGACSDPATDATNCGACGTVCGGTPGRAQACVAGTCGCPQGLELCGEQCVDLNNDARNCGACGNDVLFSPVLGAQRCVKGLPVQFGCGDSESYCGEDCVDTSHNEANCGACGKACAAGQICLGASCRDTTDPSLCSNGQSQMYPCEDALFCNGPASCNPDSNLADYSGCVRGPYPCAQGSTCDEATDTCSAPMCVATNFFTQTGRCAANVKTCLSTALGLPTNKLANAINCANSDKTPGAQSTNDELGEQYDCQSCIRNDLMICARNYMCKTQSDALDCCVQAKACKNQSCIQELCLPEFTALDTCFTNQPVDSRCYDFIVQTGEQCAL